MANEHDLISKGDNMIEHIKEVAPFVAALVAMIAGWWAWRTSYLKALSDRVAVLEARDEARAKEVGAAQARVAELTAELFIERERRGSAEASADKWRTRWQARRDRQRHDSSPTSLEEDTSDGDALDDLAADTSDASGLLRVPQGGIPK
jgi:hypothetical protein